MEVGGQRADLIGGIRVAKTRPHFVALMKTAIIRIGKYLIEGCVYSNLFPMAIGRLVATNCDEGVDIVCAASVGGLATAIAAVDSGLDVLVANAAGIGVADDGSDRYFWELFQGRSPEHPTRQCRFGWSSI
ncbi:hypothetical protein [Mycobacterium sp. 1274761.0]|uniref:hypothetical protein n=1 Tax=Mycobacterium sp. 1274761.0 TaxID=1834077 RepID=UPI0012E902D9|nr:hypothetical protein [Mycobacterium sp. 1274761.0]